jgi:glutathione S-transferase
MMPASPGETPMMKLIGMFDSPFVRPVAISARLLGIPFEHLNWSVGKDFDRIRQYSPLGRAPTLVLDDGEVLVECFAMLDYLNDRAGPERALLPASGAERRAALRLMSFAYGAAEKAREEIVERVFRPADKRHPPWIERCRGQLRGALAELERHAAQKRDAQWLVGGRMTQADVYVSCIFTFLTEAVPEAFEPRDYPMLRAHVARVEAMPEFRDTRAPWFAPTTTTALPVRSRAPKKRARKVEKKKPRSATRRPRRATRKRRR